MTPSAQELLTEVEALEQLPLLGDSLTEAERVEAQLTELLLRRPDAALATRALLRRGERLLALGDPAAAATLAEVAERARALGAPKHDLKARLLATRALARVGSLPDALALLSRAAEESEGDPELALDRALALASVGAPGAVDELERALLEEPQPLGLDPRAQDRLVAALFIAEGRTRDAQWLDADRWYARAIEITEKHRVPELPARLTLSRAASLLRHGRRGEARAPLRLAFEEGAPLVRLGAGLLLSGVLLEEGAPREARPVAVACMALSDARHNWLAYASAAIDVSRCDELEGGLEAAKGVLTEALERCRGRGEQGTLLQARWLELAAGG